MAGDEPVRWLWIVPITERERRVAAERGSGSLVNQLTAQRRSWVYTPGERQ
jgi:Suppressor of fused protein (SUFU)